MFLPSGYSVCGVFMVAEVLSEGCETHCGSPVDEVMK